VVAYVAARGPVQRAGVPRGARRAAARRPRPERCGTCPVQAATALARTLGILTNDSPRRLLAVLLMVVGTFGALMGSALLIAQLRYWERAEARYRERYRALVATDVS
jgi:hypothetical protein